ncbi:MAG: transpeptidase [Pelagibacterales bacterium MED-G44]|nr:MAG: transpeptidase [Pelagibacterales bacterium MED-G44]
MRIILKNKETLLYDGFKFRCSIGKNGTTSNKIEGDRKTPKGIFSLGPVFYRKDRIKNLVTKLKKKKINRLMGWCDDVKNQKYNKLIKVNNKIKHEKLFQKRINYDLIIPIKYNFKKTKKNKGSAIFIHVTEDYKKTLGCIALKKNDLLILLKLINKNTKIQIL